MTLSKESKYKTPYVPKQFSNPSLQSFVWTSNVNSRLEYVLENFLDGSHTHFVHAGVIRSDKKRQSILATPKRVERGIELEYSQEKKQSGWISQLFESDRFLSYGRFLLPSIAELEYQSKSGITFMLSIYFTPESETRQKAFAISSLKKTKVPEWLQGLIVTPFFNLVLKQDKQVLEIQEKHRIKEKKVNWVSDESDLIYPYLKHLLEGKPIEEMAITVPISILC